jgi:deoxyribodipyrimidine photo-lyase
MAQQDGAKQDGAKQDGAKQDGAKQDGTAILWFRQDLRLADHPALAASLAGAARVVPVYVLDDAASGEWGLGGAAKWWLHHSLEDLGKSLAEKGARLVLRRGDPAEIIPDLAKQLGAHSVHAGVAHEPRWRQLDERISASLKSAGSRLVRHRVATLFDPWNIRTKSGGTYGIYTPFARAMQAGPAPAKPIPAPGKIPGGTPPQSDTLRDWRLLPTKPDWAGGLRDAWQPGEAAAAARLRHFLGTAVDQYDTGRNLPGQDATSALSPYLHWGEISPNTIWHAARRHAATQGVQTYLSELIWRDFNAYLLWHNPGLPDHPLRADFAKLPWRRDKAGLNAWQRGQTGVPIVDAGMRQLWQTGWMHNRVRMIVGSYLTKHLLIRWQDGEAWFWDTLVDADLASNAGNWQWVAGCGVDAQPYFRIFNPVSQGQKFDPDGAYVRRFVPELAALPDTFLHNPWDAPDNILGAAGVTLGVTYPRPLIDLALGRTRALEAYRTHVRSARNEA